MDYSAEAKRNRFFRGKRMQAEEFTIEQGYGIERRRLINRTVLGWGVAAGYELTEQGKPKDSAPLPKAEPSENGPDQSSAASRDDLATSTPLEASGHPQPVEGGYADQQSQPAADTYGATSQVEDRTKHYPLLIGEGFALDKIGREVVCEETLLDKTNTFIMVWDNGAWCARDLSKLTAGSYTLAVHYAEEKSGAVVPAHLCGCSHPERGYVTETAVFSLRTRVEDCGCGDPDCASDNCTDCVHDACVGDIRGPHARLSQWINGRKVGFQSHLHCWDRYDIALHEGIDLACIHVEPAERDCDPFKVIIEDASGPRRLVKNNDLLFDLIRGADLACIKDFSWKAWHRNLTFMSWDVFDQLLSDITVTLSRPVRVSSLQPDVVVITAYIENSEGWRRAYRIPTELVSMPTKPMVPGQTDRFQVVHDQTWSTDEAAKLANSKFQDNPSFYVEIEVRGDLIEDCGGLHLDANKDGVPGGTFVSRLRVLAKERPPKQGKSE